MFATINPATGETVREFPETPPAELIDILGKADDDQRAWARQSTDARVDPIRRLAEHLRTRADSLAELMTLEMGKPIKEARAEVDKCAWVCDFYASHAPSFLEDEDVEAAKGRRAIISTEPLGIILAIMPWNFPFWQVFRAGIPALAAGNGILLKHAPNVPQCALSIEALFQQAGFPMNLFRTVLATEPTIACAFVHPAVQGVTLTGSTGAGSKVAAQAGSQLKKTVLELGGSDPYLILPDADIDSAVEACTASRMINSGQSCIAAKRFITVGETTHAAFLGGLTEAMRAYPSGDPTDPETRLGPLARPDLRDRLHEQVEASVHAGAKRQLGGEIPRRPGNWYPATVLSGVKPGMPAFDEELFGPVAAVIRAEDEADAVELANHSAYGLGAGVFTADADRGMNLARRLQVGSVAINDFVKSDPRQPFGGIRQSGYGRELGRDGIYEFANRKTIVYSA